MKLIRTLSLPALLRAKAENPAAPCIAGGTDLMVNARQAGFLPDCLLDVSDNPDLRGIALREGKLALGAAVTFSELEASDLVRQYAPLLALAAAQVGSPQIRNRGTLGGNVVNASPAADSLAALAAQDCSLVLVNALTGRERRAALSEFILGPYRPGLEAGEVLVELLLSPKPPEAGCAYRKVGRRNALAIARMSAACMLCGAGGRLTQARLAVGAVLPAPERLAAAEQILLSGPYSPALALRAGEAARDYVLRKTGGRASAAYKMAVLPPLLQALIEEAAAPLGR